MVDRAVIIERERDREKANELEKERQRERINALSLWWYRSSDL